MTGYPVTFDVVRPQKFERPQIFLRILLWILLSWIVGLAFLVLPIASAIFVSQKGSQKFLEEDGPKITGWLRWIIAFYAYLFILTDRFPSEKAEELVRFEVQPAGTPTVGSALLRLIFSIPSAFVLSILLMVSEVIWVIAAIMVLVQENYPEGLFDFQRGVLRWEARLLGYHASLVDQYPPFALDTGSEGSSAA
ncbi:MAG: DUF4389 domain-containing protein [Acidobacteria bacterium]|nr:DUF4389 domain-containing protein [Acidobacteriota bacterium]